MTVCESHGFNMAPHAQSVVSMQGVQENFATPCQTLESNLNRKATADAKSLVVLL